MNGPYAVPGGSPARPKVTLVVPSNRLRGLWAFLDAWSPYPWDETLVVWDGPTPCGLNGRRADRVLAWDSFAALGADAWIFSRQDAACRCFGFLAAVARGAGVVLTLDDDVHPDGDPDLFVAKHLENLYAPDPWCQAAPGIVARGTPYGTDTTPGGPCDPQVGLSMGLWRGCADLDAVHRLTRTHDRDYDPPPGVRLMHPKQFFPLSGMNLAFRAEVLPALYFPRMGQGSPYRRFDDVWGGLVAQKALAAAGYAVTAGEPFVRHDRASDVWKCLEAEAPGVAAHEHVWPLLRSAVVPAADLDGAVRDLAAHLRRRARETPLADYLRRWGEALEVWRRLCRSARREDRATGA